MEAVLEGVNTHQLDQKSLQQSLETVMVNQLSPSQYQPRRDFDPELLKELSDSIASQGILQPIVVRKTELDKYEIIAGERRWRAARMAGLQQVPVVVCSILDEHALAFSLIENIQRQDLNPIEEAEALKRLINEFNMTHEQVAKSIGRSRASVSNTLRLLNLSQPVQAFLISKKLNVGHAKLLLIFPPEQQEAMAVSIIDKDMTVRAAEQWVQSRRKRRGLSSGSNELDTSEKFQIHPKCLTWSRALSNRLSSKVSVKISSTGLGKIIISVESLDQIERLIEDL